jgi:tight adherence protein B
VFDSLFHKKKDEAPKRTYLFADSIVYTEYKVPIVERIGCMVVGFAAGFLLGEIFYGMLPIAIITAVIVSVIAVKIWSSFRIEKRSKELKLQFRDMLESVATSIGAGENVAGAFISAYADMRMQYSEDSYIVQELANIVGGMNNNLTIEELLNDFAMRSGLEDIQSFASVFETAYRKGGNIRQVIQSTYEIINDKMSVELEIQTMTASANAELNMMLAMPVVIILMLRFFGGSFSGQGSVTSVISTTIALAIFAASYFIGKKLMSIKM